MRDERGLNQSRLDEFGKHGVRDFKIFKVFSNIHAKKFNRNFSTLFWCQCKPIVHIWYPHFVFAPITNQIFVFYAFPRTRKVYKPWFFMCHERIYDFKKARKRFFG